MSSKLKVHTANLGDIDLYRDSKYVQITVDGSTVIFTDHHNATELANMILNAVKGE